MNLLLIPPFLCAVVSFAIGAFVLSRNFRSPIHRSFASLCWETTWWQVCWFATYFFNDPVHKDSIMRIAYIVITVLPVTYYHYAVRFLGRDKEWPFVRMGYLIGLFVFMPLLWTTNLYIAGYIDHWWGYYPKVGVLHPIYLVGSLTIVVRTLFILRAGAIDRRLPPVIRNRNRFAFYTHFVYALAVIEYAITYGVIEIYPVGVFALLGAFGITSYAIVRYRLLDVNVALTRAALFLFVYAPLLLLPLVLGNIFQPALTARIGENWWIIPMGVEAFFAAGGLVMYRYLQRKAEDRLLAEQRRYQETLRRASSDMTRIRSLPTLLQLIVHILTRTMRVSHATLYLFDAEKKQYVPIVSRGSGRPLSGIAVGLDDPLIRYLRASRDAIVGEEVLLQRQQQVTSVGLRELADQLRRLNADCVIPSFVHDHLLGLVVMGAKLSGRMYTDDDLKVLMTLANQAALAIENARFYEAEKERQAALFHSAQLASLGTMAGSMGHQINNRFHVLGVLAGTMKAVLSGLKPSSAQPEQLEKLQAKLLETFAKIEDNAVRGGDIVKTLLNFSKPGTVERISFPEIINMATELAQHRVKFDEIDFEPVLSNPLPPINGNKNQLTEAFYNLISNGYDAIKSKEEAIQEGRLTLLTGQTYKGKIAISVTSTVKNGATWLHAVVHDNGSGIKAEDLSHLFVPFFTTKATSQKGTGLGLYVIKGIVENHGGTIDVSSVYGEGTTFTIQLPTTGEKP